MCSPAGLDNIAFAVLESANPRNCSWNNICNKVSEVARVAFITLIVVLNCTVINPFFCTPALFIGMIFPNVVYDTMTKELFTPIHRHSVIATISITVAILVAPHFAFLAFGTLFNTYYGSKINYNKQQVDNVNN